MAPNLAREQHAVDAGLEAFARSQGADDEVDYVLRRNTHRLEKGLISRPRRRVFATSYIEETVEHLVRGLDRGGGDVRGDAELAWARDVLAAYFEVVGSSPEVDRARARFESARTPLAAGSDQRLVPFIRDVSGDPPVSYDALRALAERRRSVRWFEQRAVPREHIDAAIRVALQSPSACNRQPFEFLVFDDSELVQRVAAVPGGTAGFAHNFPVIVALVGKLNAFFSDRDRHLIYIDGSLAAMSFMFALETLGLASCAINTPGVEELEQRLSEVLELQPYERPIMLIALGYPEREGMVPRSQKKALDVLRRYTS
jgi:nitroreductase